MYIYCIYSVDLYGPSRSRPEASHSESLVRAVPGGRSGLATSLNIIIISLFVKNSAVNIQIIIVGGMC